MNRSFASGPKLLDQVEGVEQPSLIWEKEIRWEDAREGACDVGEQVRAARNCAET